jgi:hypothetical protein
MFPLKLILFYGVDTLYKWTILCETARMYLVPTYKTRTKLIINNRESAKD